MQVLDAAATERQHRQQQPALQVTSSLAAWAAAAAGAGTAGAGAAGMRAGETQQAGSRAPFKAAPAAASTAAAAAGGGAGAAATSAANSSSSTAAVRSAAKVTSNLTEWAAAPSRLAYREPQAGCLLYPGGAWGWCQYTPCLAARS